MNADVEARLYLALSRRFIAAVNLSTGVVDGVALGLLSDAALDAVDEMDYLNDGDYVDAAYNERGLYTWEQQAIDRHFPPGGHVAVTGAGGGREVLALCRQGFEVSGYEPNRTFVEQGNLLLERSGVAGRIELSGREGWPGRGAFDAVLLGWGSYHHVRSRRRRLELLRGAHQALPAGGPLVTSFYVRRGDTRYHAVVRRLANRIRRLRAVEGGDRIETGDMLSPGFVHLFTEREIRQELDDGGFAMVYFDSFEYGTAVGRARALIAHDDREGEHGS